MSLFSGNYLRVLTPETVDGITPRMENDKMCFTEQHLPVTARPFLEQENNKRSDVLKHRIELIEVGNYGNFQPQRNGKK